MKNSLLILLMALPLISFGIEPVIIKLDAESPSYTVPAGKILAIESLNYSYWDDRFGVDFINGNTTNTAFFGNVGAIGANSSVVRFAYEFNVTLPRPLKIPELTIIQRNSASTYALILFGLLIETADLYAHVAGKSGNMIVQNDSFSFDVFPASARPAKIMIKGSGDLSSWEPIGNSSIKRTSTGAYTVSIPTENREKLYARYSIQGIQP